MDRIRSSFDDMIKGRRYIKFFQKRGEEEEDDDRHVELKLSEDGSEDVADSPNHKPTLFNRLRLLYMCLAMLSLFLLGYILAYYIHHKPKMEATPLTHLTPLTPSTPSTSTPSQSPAVPEEVQLSWDNIVDLFKKKLSAENFAKTLNEYDLPNRSAGSSGDKLLAQRIFDEFNRLEMKPWTDLHHVQLQTPDGNRPNLVTFGEQVFKPKGYFAYSNTGKVEGKLVYGSYGRAEDLTVLQENKVELKDAVLLLRAGNITFAEQVNNAEARGVAAVLIFPDPKEYDFRAETELFGHVHLGSGDPFTPGFPSFPNTQFPPINSSGLPKIPVQSVAATISNALLKNIGGPASPYDFKGGFNDVGYSLGGTKNITVEVNNVLADRELNNVFGVIEGSVDPDRYIVLGAQRDAWGKGYAQATVGTSVLMELARALQEMKKDGVRLRRSLVFASWSAGEYGSVGATEWLEAYMSSLDRRVVSYISLDGVVMGRGSFMASASPLLYSLLEKTLKKVDSPTGSGTLYDLMGAQWESTVIRPMSLDDPSYPFLAFSGIPSISFHFISPNTEVYPYYGTNLDSKDHLDYSTGQRTSDLAVLAAQFSGHMALRLAHDHLINLDVTRYGNVLAKLVNKIYMRIRELSRSGKLVDVTPSWLTSARGSFMRAGSSLNLAFSNTDTNDPEACRILNDRVMSIEHSLLSPYVSPMTTPFRHIVFGRGSHTLPSIAATTDIEELRIQLALATWSLQGCANAMVGEIWDLKSTA